jgi:PadR family transcriptional regulator AphA
MTFSGGSHNVEVMGSPKMLSLSEWAVLGLVAEGQTHGFAVAREFAPDGAIGKIWTMPRPLVYRAITSLVAKELVAETGWARGDAAPQRRLLAATKTGRDAIGVWLVQPVAHVRDARTELLIKLLLLDRAGIDATPLLVAQKIAVEPMLESLRGQLEPGHDPDSTIIRWRLYSTEALLRFLDDLLEHKTSKKF